MDKQEGWIETEGGLRLYYRRMGDGPEVLLVPNAVFLEKMLAPLAEHRTVIFYDMRSRGRSDRIEDPDKLGIHHEVADLEAVRRHFELERTAILGHSYLSVVVALYAAKYPQVVSRFAMVGVLPIRRPPQYVLPPVEVMVSAPGVPHLAELRKAGLPERDPPAYARAWMKEFLLPTQLADPSYVERIPLDACDHPNEFPAHVAKMFMERIVPSLGDWDFRPLAAAASMPALVVQGAQERVGVAPAREWAAHLPDARLLVIPASGHYPFAENPQAFFPALERFLGGSFPENAESVPRQS